MTAPRKPDSRSPALSGLAHPASPLAPALALPLTGATLDRASELRADRNEMLRLLDDPRAAVLGASADSVLIVDSPRPQLLRRPLAGNINPHQPILLGIDAGAPLFAADLDDPEAQSHASDTGLGRLVTLREAGLLLPQAEGGLAAYLVALLGWHRNHRFCARCGGPTRVAQAGLARHCPSCRASHFPRTDPVVIMLVDDGAGHVLLGRRIGWEAGRFSILAGYVAPGETPEEAVLREVYEESAVHARAPRYVASQPWPFPASLMLGYEASAAPGSAQQPRPQPGEMVEVAWFSLDQVREAAQVEDRPDGHDRAGACLRLPGEVSIARRLIDAWVARGGHRLDT
jgi:NAD+ diphosphatase